MIPIFFSGFRLLIDMVTCTKSFSECKFLWEIFESLASKVRSTFKQSLLDAPEFSLKQNKKTVGTFNPTTIQHLIQNICTFCTYTICTMYNICTFVLYAIHSSGKCIHSTVFQWKSKISFCVLT